MQSKPSLGRQLLASCQPLIVFSVLANLLMLATPLHMMQIYDRVLVSGSVETLLYITLITIAALGFFGLAETLRNRIAQRVAADFAVERADALFARLTDGKTAPASADRLMQDFSVLRSFLASRAMVGLFDLPFAPAFLLLLFVLHFQLGMVATLGMVTLVALAFTNRLVAGPPQSVASEANGEAIGFASAAARRGDDIRAMGLLPALGERFGALIARGLIAQDEASARNSAFFGASRALRQVLQIGIMAWGAGLVLAGDMSGGVIFAASIITGRALQPIEQLIGGWDSVSRAREAAARLTAALAEDQIAPPVTQPKPLGRLSVADLSLQVQAGSELHTIVDGVSFKLEPGTALAIIGASGAGKSTIARMIGGAVHPSGGEIRLDGCAQMNWPAEQWGACVGYVGQEILLFSGTIAENIARMAPQPDEAKVVQAARMAGAHDLINRLPEGYGTRIGEGGVRLSGGQAQRIALARALYSEPCLLVLDEPNAHLDAAGEAMLLDCLKKLKRQGTTIVVVSQRRSVLAIADQVMTVADGGVQSLKPIDRRPVRPSARRSTISAIRRVNRSQTPVGDNAATHDGWAGAG
ncbi:MAG: type I secretion system permease/ATPase [Nitratireductor sp.]|nr:type I secretion system permease/ATPase [Nitratireductor sp.]